LTEKEAKNEFVTWQELERALKATREDISPPTPHKQHPSEEIQHILQEIGELRGKHTDLDKRVTDTETALRDKVTSQKPRGLFVT
jgi:chromosome segregation ATPase